MSDYQFKCPDCKKVTSTHSTGEIPLIEDFVECISCGRIAIVQDSLTTLFVGMTQKKRFPSELDKLEQRKQNKIQEQIKQSVALEPKGDSQ